MWHRASRVTQTHLITTEEITQLTCSAKDHKAIINCSSMHLKIGCLGKHFNWISQIFQWVYFPSWSNALGQARTSWSFCYTTSGSRDKADYNIPSELTSCSAIKEVRAAPCLLLLWTWSSAKKTLASSECTCKSTFITRLHPPKLKGVASQF